MSDVGNGVFALTTTKFYGKAKSNKSFNTDKRKSERNFKDFRFQKWPRQLDPAATWKVFKKQQDALEYVTMRKNGLMAFAFQDAFGRRMFLVAHPSVFWFYDCKRNAEDRCSYEIILEHAVCKLYFDLEFSKDLNCQHDGNRMTESFVKIISFHLKKEWGITVDRHNVLDLDSSTEKKFSRHLIFILPDAIFEDNHCVGNFVKDICTCLRTFIDACERNYDCSETNSYDSVIDKRYICELLVLDGKGISRLFCDEGVYTKNRHFRLYLSTKKNKNAPLVLSETNQYSPVGSLENVRPDLQVFLDSLITYVPVDDLKVLRYGRGDRQDLCSSKACSESVPSSSYATSPYPELDKFITNMISPGWIWRWVHFSSRNHLVYDIVGYRYCGNIGRHHRSNNIKYVVNLSGYTYYQKCHDPECVDYRSAEHKLPAELTFLLEDDSFLAAEDNSTFSTTLGHFGMLEEDFLQFVEAVECVDDDKSDNLFLPEDTLSASSTFPNYGLSDCDITAVLSTADI